MKKIFIDGAEGTTGLKIFDFLSARKDIEIIKLSDEFKKDISARRDYINKSDFTFLCVPDDAAIDAVKLVENKNTVIIDASTAHRTNEMFAYGFPELDEIYFNKIKNSNFISLPGCHASGFIAITYPLIKYNIISNDTLIACTSITGYSGGGKKMIAEYEKKDRDIEYSSPRLYALSQQHKHLKEMKYHTGINNYPIFMPLVCDFYSGMQVMLPLDVKFFKKNYNIKMLLELFSEHYKSHKLIEINKTDNISFIPSNLMQNENGMKIFISGNDERIILSAVYDNLRKGASGAGIECMNIKMGLEMDLL